MNGKATPTAADAGEAVLEFWFEFGSNYSYLAAMRVEQLAGEAGVKVQWTPFLLGPIFRDLGWNTSPFVLQEAKGRYVWRDMERQAAKYGLPFVRPSVFPRRALLPLRVAAMGACQPWIGEFCRRVMRQNWAEDLEIEEEGNVARALAGLVPDPAACIAAARTEAGKELLRMQTEQAKRRGIFGAPTLFAGDEMFWGNDRLEDAIAFAAVRQRG